jgi:hypothetical protein
LVISCSDATDHSDCGSAYGGDTSLMTWWRPGASAESNAQDRLVEGYLRCSGGQVTVESSLGDKEAALRINEAEQKSLLLVNGLADIDRLQCTADRGTGLFALHDLDRVRWQNRIPHFLLPYVRPCGGEDQGRLFAVPVGLHTLNRVVLAPTHSDSLLQGASTPSDFLSWLERRAAEGMAKPIAVPANIEPSFLLVENIMVAVAGERYQEFWNLNRRTESRSDVDMQPFEDALDFADRLLPFIEYVEADGERDALAASMHKVCTGEAALSVQADWFDPADFCEGLVPAPFPGTAKYEVFGFDAFAVDHSDASADLDAPAYLARGSSEYAWLKAATSLEVQTAYAREKHSRVLVELDADGNSVALQSEDLFGPDVTPLPGLLLVVKHSSFETFGDEIDAYMKDPPEDEQERTARRAQLVTYVHDQLCSLTACRPSAVP